MHDVMREFTISCDADKAWSVFSDFAGFLNWAGSGDIRIEGEGIGMIRHLNMGVGEIAERLDKKDDDTRTLAYSLVYGEPLGMKVYRAEVRLTSSGDGSTTLHWHGSFETTGDVNAADVNSNLAAAFEGMSHAQGC